MDGWIGEVQEVSVCPVMMSAKSVEKMLFNILQICASIISLSWVGTGSLSSNRGPPTQHPFLHFFFSFVSIFSFFPLCLHLFFFPFLGRDCVEPS